MEYQSTSAMRCSNLLESTWDSRVLSRLFSYSLITPNGTNSRFNYALCICKSDDMDELAGIFIKYVNDPMSQDQVELSLARYLVKSKHNDVVHRNQVWAKVARFLNFSEHDEEVILSYETFYYYLNLLCIKPCRCIP